MWLTGWLTPYCYCFPRQWLSVEHNGRPLPILIGFLGHVYRAETESHTDQIYLFMIRQTHSCSKHAKMFLGFKYMPFFGRHILNVQFVLFFKRYSLFFWNSRSYHNCFHIWFAMFFIIKLFILKEPQLRR